MATRTFRTGFGEVEKAAEEAKGGYSGRLGFFGLKDGESVILRFLSDDPLTTKFYEYVQGSDGKSTSFIVAPDLYAEDPDWDGEDWVLKYGGKTKEYGSTELTDPKPVTRTVNVAVIREEVLDDTATGRRKTKTQDKLSSFENKDGVKFDCREFIVVRQSYKNFWASLVECFHEYGTICDRDYKITRRGGDKGTVYNIIPRDEDPDFDLADLHARYGYGTGKTVDGEEITPDNPDRFLYCPQTLVEWAEEMASEERAKHFLGNVKADASSRRSGGSGGDSWRGSDDDEANAAPAPASDASALRARLQRHNRGGN